MQTIYYCFPQGKFKVLTMSYDDGKIADRKLIEIFNRYGIKGTFHLNAGLIDNRDDRIQPDEIKTLYSGHEVAAHTYTHPTIARCPIEQVVQQVLEDRKSLEKIVGHTVRGLSYPNGSYTKQIKEMLPHVGIEYSRVVGTTRGFGMPEDLYAWQATCHHNHNLMDLAKTFSELSKKQYLYMMYVWGHSYEFDLAGNWDLMEEFCKFIGSRDDTWYATNIEIVDYLNALKNLKFSAAGDFVCNPSAMPVWISVSGEIVKVEGGAQVQLFSI